MYEIYLTGDTSGLSLSMYIIFVFGVFTWMVYGVCKRASSLVMANMVTFLLAGFILLKIVQNLYFPDESGDDDIDRVELQTESLQNDMQLLANETSQLDATLDAEQATLDSQQAMLDAIVACLAWTNSHGDNWCAQRADAGRCEAPDFRSRCQLLCADFGFPCDPLAAATEAAKANENNQTRRLLPSVPVPVRDGAARTGARKPGRLLLLGRLLLPWPSELGGSTTPR